MDSARKIPSAANACAIYTRKSSEEGLEQEFNSLHAQREACEAYIGQPTLRKAGLWSAVSMNDGGISGGHAFGTARPSSSFWPTIEDGLIEVWWSSTRSTACRAR